MNCCSQSLQTLSEKCLLETAMCAVRRAGRVQSACRSKALSVERLMVHDVKLEADRLSENAIAKIILESFPDSGIFAEEGGGTPSKGLLTWFVDPLDGTMNYFHGQRHFCSSVACYSGTERDSGSIGVESLGRPIAGAVYAAAYKEMFAAMSGGGSLCDGATLRVSDAASLSNAIVATSFGSSPETMRRMSRLVPVLAQETWKIRMQGCCALDICAVAAGRLTALYQPSVRPWDFAAARIVLEEAGGRFEAIEKANDKWDVLAAAPGVFDELREIVHSL